MVPRNSVLSLLVPIATLLSFACGPASSPTSKNSSTSNAAMVKADAASSAVTVASSFAVLANAAVTCTNGSIAGDVGTFLASPTGSVTLTSCPVTGAVHVGDAASQQAFNQFLGAYTALAPKAGDVCTSLTGTLAGVTLAPGNYCFDAAATLTGVLTLNGPSTGVWTIKVGTLGTGALTGTGFSVVMAGGGLPCNVTWWVSQATTMTTSAFQGNILAGAAITTTGGTFNGNAWSKADVTNTGTVVTSCATVVSGGPPPPPPCDKRCGCASDGEDGKFTSHEKHHDSVAWRDRDGREHDDECDDDDNHRHGDDDHHHHGNHEGDGR
jgi:hypothetical protein